jgi:hypothetical protein
MVTQQEFTFPFHKELAPAELEQVSPRPQDYETATYDFSASGDVTGVVVPTNDIVIPPTAEPSSTSGCVGHRHRRPTRIGPDRGPVQRLLRQPGLATEPTAPPTPS